MQHHNTGAPPTLVGRNAVRTALTQKQEGTYDHLVLITLTLLFHPTTRETGKGMMAEIFRGHHKQDPTTPQDNTLLPNAHDVVAELAVSRFSPQHANALLQAIPGPCLIDTLGSILMYALIEEDSGWARTAKDQIESLLQRDKKHATNYRIAEMCSEIVMGLRKVLTPDGRLDGKQFTTSCRRCLAWMADRMILGLFDRHTERPARFASAPNTLLLKNTEWVAETMQEQEVNWPLDIGIQLGTLSGTHYPALAAIGANIRRTHLKKQEMGKEHRDREDIELSEEERRL